MSVRIKFRVAFVCILVFVSLSCNSVPLATEPVLIPDSTTLSPSPSNTIEEIGQPRPTAQILEKPAIAPTVDISMMNIGLKQELYFTWGAEEGPSSSGCTRKLFAKYDVSRESVHEFYVSGAVPPELKETTVSPFFLRSVDDEIHLCIYGFPEDEIITIELYTPEDTLCVSQEVRVSDYYHLAVGEITEVDFAMDWPRCSQAGQWALVVKSARVSLWKPIQISWEDMAKLSASRLCDSPDSYVSVQGVGYPHGESRLLGVYGACFSPDQDYEKVCELMESYSIRIGDDGSFDVLLPPNLSGEYIVVPIMRDDPPEIGRSLGSLLTPGVIDYPEPSSDDALSRPFERNLYLKDPWMSGNDVVAVQRRLYDLGYTEVGAVDGRFGPMTKSAVLLFQETNRLPENGVVDQQVWQVLFSENAIGKR
jgi:hypothetical protein